MARTLERRVRRCCQSYSKLPTSNMLFNFLSISNFTDPDLARTRSTFHIAASLGSRHERERVDELRVPIQYRVEADKEIVP